MNSYCRLTFRNVRRLALVLPSHTYAGANWKCRVTLTAKVVSTVAAFSECRRDAPLVLFSGCFLHKGSVRCT